MVKTAASPSCLYNHPSEEGRFRFSPVRLLVYWSGIWFQPDPMNGRLYFNEVTVTHFLMFVQNGHDSVSEFGFVDVCQVNRLNPVRGVCFLPAGPRGVRGTVGPSTVSATGKFVTSSRVDPLSCHESPPEDTYRDENRGETISSVPCPVRETSKVRLRTLNDTTMCLETKQDAFVKFETRILNSSPRRSSCIPLAT